MRLTDSQHLICKHSLSEIAHRSTELQNPRSGADDLASRNEYPIAHLAIPNPHVPTASILRDHIGNVIRRHADDVAQLMGFVHSHGSPPHFLLFAYGTTGKKLHKRNSRCGRKSRYCNARQLVSECPKLARLPNSDACGVAA